MFREKKIQDFSPETQGVFLNSKNLGNLLLAKKILYKNCIRWERFTKKMLKSRGKLPPPLLPCEEEYNTN